MPVCENCGKGEKDGKELMYGPDPYAEEIKNDTIPVWLCAECYCESCADI